MNPPLNCERFYYNWGPHQPALRVMSGDTVRIACPDADNGLADGSPIPRDRRQALPQGSFVEGNPLSGPIFVEGLTQGDTLAVDVLDVEIDRSYGLTLLAPAHGALERENLVRGENQEVESVPRHMYRWDIDIRRGTAELSNPLGKERLAVPLAPMIGCLGVCPNSTEPPSSLLAGSFGGNLDLPLVKSGATVLLPVQRPGGLLMLGDIHAAQGAGEIVGGGIETSGVATIRLRRIAGRTIATPRVIVDGMAATAAVEGDLRTAVTTAYARLLDWLCEGGTLNRWDAYQFVSHTGKMELGAIANPQFSTVAAGILIKLLPQATRKEMESWQSSAGP